MKKRIGFSIVLAILIVTMGFGFNPAPKVVEAANPSLTRGDVGAYVPGQLIVGFAPGASMGPLTVQAEGLAQSVGATVLKTDAQGMTLLDVGTGANVPMLATRMRRMKGVRYAEPNYIYQAAQQPAVTASVPLPESTGDLQVTAQTSAVPSVYPNDPYVFWNQGWIDVLADIVWTNKTASKGVCLLDTGVDYTHKDLAANITKGKDFVNNDADPMDDSGHGTYVAGIIAAVRNNNEGIAGISTGKVLAVKVLDANGSGTVFDISQGIRYCADNSSVSILNIAWTGPDSGTLQSAIGYAVSKGKLIVAAAGDKNANSKASSYPSSYSSGFPAISDHVMAIAASDPTLAAPNKNCKSSQSNVGDWITEFAPGVGILSTTPWDKSFKLNSLYGVTPRYGYVDGTAPASAFVAAEAARLWGYKPSLTVPEVVTTIQQTGYHVNPNGGSCWPTNLGSNVTHINIAGAMERGEVAVGVRDAVTGNPLTGATVSIYAVGSSTLVASGVVPISMIDPHTGATTLFPDYAPIYNMPANSTFYVAKVSAPGYTASAQNALVGNPNIVTADGTFKAYPGIYMGAGVVYLPPKTGNFTLVGETSALVSNLNLVVWLPTDPGYVVNKNFAFLNNPAIWGDVWPYGALSVAPFARWMNSDSFSQSIVIANRKTGSALPYYQGTYSVAITDSGNDGTDNYLDNINVSLFVWKDGVIKKRVDKTDSITCGKDNHWWWPLTFDSAASGAVNYHPKTDVSACGDYTNKPY